MSKLKVPIIILNYKTYSEGTGKKAFYLSKIADEVSKETGVNIGIAAQVVDILSITNQFTIPVFSQHVDPIRYGSYTGQILLESVKEAGAVGTLINHSEKQLKLSEIDTIISKTRELGMISVVCVNNAAVGTAVAVLNPDVISFHGLRK